MKIAITAASGALGTAIIEELKKNVPADNIVGIARTPENAKNLGVEIRKGDYKIKNDFDIALKGIDVVLLISGMDHPQNRIPQHRNVINAAKDAGVKKIVYTSIFGKDGESTFDAIVKSNRQTEKDIQESGLEWAIGRNGLYIEPDIEYIEKYKKSGKIINCAGEGKVSYTTRSELAYAYSQMILNEDRNGQIFNLGGTSISQKQLANYLNKAFGTELVFENVSPEKYLEMQKEMNGEFLGPIIAGIYTKINNGEFEMESDYFNAAGREHVRWDEFFEELKNK
jgi:NAD(P)H dehydrogenase (quinone)